MTLNRYRKWRTQAEACTSCPISSLCRNKVLPVLEHSTADILFVGEAPGQVEYVEKEPFVGPSGMTLQAIIEEAVPPDKSYIITNAILCTPFTDPTRYNIRQPSLSEVKECGKWLLQLINKSSPTHFVALGKIAALALENIGIQEYLLVLHPSKILQSTRYDYEFDKAVLKISSYIAKEIQETA